MAVIAVSGCGVATSGNYRNFKQTSSGRVWHTISTTDGLPAHTDLLSATVIAPSAMEADAYATACMDRSASGNPKSDRFKLCHCTNTWLS